MSNLGLCFSITYTNSVEVFWQSKNFFFWQFRIIRNCQVRKFRIWIISCDKMIQPVVIFPHLDSSDWKGSFGKLKTFSLGSKGWVIFDAGEVLDVPLLWWTESFRVWHLESSNNYKTLKLLCIGRGVSFPNILWKFTLSFYSLHHKPMHPLFLPHNQQLQQLSLHLPYQEHQTWLSA